MDSAGFLGKEWNSSDAETTLESEIESDESPESDFCDCKVLVQHKPLQLLQEEAGPELEEVYIEVSVSEHMVVCIFHPSNQLNIDVMMKTIKHPQLKIVQSQKRKV